MRVMSNSTTAEGPLDTLPMIGAVNSSDHPASSLGNYRRYLEDRRCWADGTPTHASSGQQRQCPKCRRKWSYEHRLLQVTLLEQYCQGINASRAAKNIGCAKNTARSHYDGFRIVMERVMKSMLANEEVATNPVTIRELASLEKALRAGSVNRREKACRHLFLCSLCYEERLQAIFRNMVVPDVTSMIEDATQPAEPPRMPRPALSKPAPPSRPSAPSRPSLPSKPSAASRPSTPMPASRPRQQAESLFGPVSFPREELEPQLRRVRLRDRWKTLWREIRGRWDPNCPYPSQACKNLGTTWTAIWEKTRETVRKARRAGSRPRI